jgi:hypothetical protein
MRFQIGDTAVPRSISSQIREVINDSKSSNNPEKIPVIHTVEKNIKSSSIKINGQIFNYTKKYIDEASEITESFKRKPGRPKKKDFEKVQPLTIKLSPKNILYLKGLSFGRGMSTKIKIILDQFRRYKEREDRQVKMLRLNLHKAESEIAKIKNGDFSLLSDNNNEIVSNIYSIAKEVKTYMSILGINHIDTIEMLSKEDQKTLEFLVNMIENIRFGP